MEKISKIIENNLESKNMTQTELGNRLGLSQKAISKYVTGKSLPSIDTLEKICRILDINIASIFQQKSGDTHFRNKDELEVMTIYRTLDHTQKRIIKSLLENMQKK